MNKKQSVINTILKQTTPFYSTTITTLSGSSPALVSNTLNELLERGKILSKREGKKIVYTLANVHNNVKTTITQEPLYSIKEKFEYIRNLVDMVIKGIQPSVLITGQPGVGKSYVVRDTLRKAGMKMDEDYIQVSGHSSPFGLYKLLHDNRDATIVFDDTDSLFNNDISANILKAALDSYDRRYISWYSNVAEQKELDPSFEFTGNIIFISNMFAERIDSAIRSRAFCFDLQMTKDEISEHMQNIIDNVEPNVSSKLKQETLDYLKTIHDTFELYSLRTFIQSIRIRAYCQDKNLNWKEMIQVLANDV